MKKRTICLITAVLLIFGLAGCGGGPAVYVQSVAELAGMGGIAPGDRFAGIVVSENVAEIRRDPDKIIEELFVREGDDVQEGDPLFCYDMEQLQLTLDKQRLELEQLKATIESYRDKIKQLEKERARVYGSAKLQYTVEIQSTEVDLKEAELKIKTKEAEIAQSEAILENTTVVSPVTGRIQAISESGTDNMGNPTPYITIQQSGSYRVKGMLGELQWGGIQEGTRLRIVSRTDPHTFWTGTVTLVDYENPSQGNNNSNYYGMAADEMTASSRYPFYVELDDTAGLLLGQHVYMELLTEDGAPAGPAISSAFFCMEEDGSYYVWAEKNGRLEKRPVTLGEYNPMTDTFEILEGLTETDYIAFPDPEYCAEGVATTHSQPQPEEDAGENGESGVA